MKKSSLTRQLFFIYTLVLLITSFTFYSVLSSWLINIYTDINYTKLDDFGNTLEALINSNTELGTLDYENDIEYVIWNKDGHYYHSEGVFKIITAEYVTDLYQAIIINLENEDIYRSELDTIDEYFYSAKRTETGEYYILTVSSGLLINVMQRETGYQIMVLFMLTLIAGGLIIGFWSSILVRRITNIGEHVKNMPNVSYKDSYEDSSTDEIGLLSRSIDDMREQIYYNEETKKEIIQNLSHDIKTPIAVIKSYAEAILDGVETPEASSVIIRQSDILQHKAERLLQLNRLNYLENDKAFEEIKLNYVINRVVNNIKYLTDIKFELDLDESIFKGYEENYQTILENILSNAIRYANEKIIITLKDNVLIIYNDGKHIDNKFLDAQFKAYEKGSEGVFGVGMSIVKKTVDFFKLELYVQNEEVGVSFIIRDYKK